MTELNIPKFFDQVEEKQYLLTEEFPEVMQINVGSLCNITCSHCHVDGGPKLLNRLSKHSKLVNIKRWILQVVHLRWIQTSDGF